jgi:hypothetical protein
MMVPKWLAEAAVMTEVQTLFAKAAGFGDHY